MKNDVIEGLDNCCSMCWENVGDNGIEVICLVGYKPLLLCSRECMDEDMVEIPQDAYNMDADEPYIPEWAYSDYVPEPVSVDVAVPVVQVRAPWDAVTDVLAYEEVDDEVGVDA